MAAAATTLLALCALLASAGAENQCTTETYGYTTDWEIPLQSVTLEPPRRIWRITSPSNFVCASASSYAVGVLVTACDPDAPLPPTVNIVSLELAIVTRNSYIVVSPAHVYVNVYCKPYGHKGIKHAEEVEEAGGDIDVAAVVGESRGDLSRLRAKGVGVGGRGLLTAVPLG